MWPLTGRKRCSPLCILRRESQGRHTGQLQWHRHRWDFVRSRDTSGRKCSGPRRKRRSAQLTQTLRYVSRPRPISLAGQHSRSGQLVAVKTTVAHTRSPGMVTSLHLPMMHLRWRTTLDNWNDHTVFSKNHQWFLWYLCRSRNQQSSGTRLFTLF